MDTHRLGYPILAVISILVMHYFPVLYTEYTGYKLGIDTAVYKLRAAVETTTTDSDMLIQLPAVDTTATDSDIVIEACNNPPELDQVRWTVIQRALEVFNQFDAPYLLSFGSLLHLYRECGVGLSDIDFTLDHYWWNENKRELDKKLQDAGFKKETAYGEIGNFGFEEAWKMNEIKVDIFSSHIEGNNLVSGLWVKGECYPCFMPVQPASTFLWRGSIRVRIPDPVEEALVAMYGINYAHPLEKWEWAVYPFLTSNCSYKNNNYRNWTIN